MGSKRAVWNTAHLAATHVDNDRKIALLTSSILSTIYKSPTNQLQTTDFLPKEIALYRLSVQRLKVYLTGKSK
jgi:hypothetical protein